MTVTPVGALKDLQHDWLTAHETIDTPTGCQRVGSLAVVAVQGGKTVLFWHDFTANKNSNGPG